MLQNVFFFLGGVGRGVEHHNSKKNVYSGTQHNQHTKNQLKCLTKKNSKEKEQI